jgi:hypothetical protein
MDHCLDRIPRELWLIIAKELSLADLSVLYSVLRNPLRVSALQAISAAATSSLNSILLKDQVFPYLAIQGEAPPSTNPTGPKTIKRKRSAPPKPELPQRRVPRPYRPFFDPATFRRRLLFFNKSSPSMLPDLSLSTSRIAGHRYFISPRFGTRPIEPISLVLYFSLDGNFVNTKLVLNYVKGPESLKETAVENYLPQLELNIRSVYQKLQLQSACWESGNSKSQVLPTPWLRDFERIFVRSTFRKCPQGTDQSPADQSPALRREFYLSNVEFLFRGVSIPPSCEIPELGAQEVEEEDLGANAVQWSEYD